MTKTTRSPIGIALLAIVLGLIAAAPAAAKQGNMRQALQLLKEAKESVQASHFDNRQRKEEALGAIDRAIAQTRKGIEEGQDDDED
jgi:hypothetical protein